MRYRSFRITLQEIARWTVAVLVFGLPAAVIAAEEKVPAAGDKVRLLISGELAGFREAKNLIHPRGGLGDEDAGLLHAVLEGRRKAAKEKPGAKVIPILMGNNLGREIKADAKTASVGLHGTAAFRASRNLFRVSARQMEGLTGPEQLESLARALSLERPKEYFEKAVACLEYCEIPGSQVNPATGVSKSAELKAEVVALYDLFDQTGIGFESCQEKLAQARGNADALDAVLDECGWELFLEETRLDLKESFAASKIPFNRCQEDLDRLNNPIPSRRLAVLEACDRELLIGQIQTNFSAIALGPGDFNDLSDVKTLRDLRHYPFIASNIFVESETFHRLKGEERDLKKPFVFKREIFPTDSFVLELREKDFKRLRLVEIEEQNPRFPFWRRVIRFVPREKAASSHFDHEYQVLESGQPGAIHTVRYSAKKLASEKDGKLTLKWPVPLRPASLYQVVVRWQKPESKPESAGPQAKSSQKGKSEKRVKFVDDGFDAASFQTFELFTVTDSKSKRIRKTSEYIPLEAPARWDEREPVLYFDNQDMPYPPWVEGAEEDQDKKQQDQVQVPVIDARKIRDFEGGQEPKLNVPLYIIGVMEENDRWRIERLPANGQQGPVPIVNQIQILPMATAVEYWKQMIDLLENHGALESVLEALANHPDRLGDDYEDFKGLRENDSGWGEESWKHEKNAWTCLEEVARVSKSKPCDSGGAPGAFFDLRWQSLQKTASRFKTPPLWILLAQAEPERVNELSQKFSDSTLIVGASVHKSKGPKSASLEIVSPIEPLVVHPEEFAATLDTVDLAFLQSSPWRLGGTSRARQEVVGHPLPLLFEERQPGTKACCGGELARLQKTAILDKKLPVSESSSQLDGTHLRDWLEMRMRQVSKAEVAIIEEGIIDPDVLGWIRGLRYILESEPIDIKTASIAQLVAVPGIGESLARKIKAHTVPATKQGIANRSELREFWKDKVPDGDPAWDWVKWFIGGEGGDTLGDCGRPYVNQDVFLDQFFRRLVFVNHRLDKVIVTQDQLKKLRDELKKRTGFREQGLDTSAKNPKLNYSTLGGKKPVTVALLSNLSTEQGPFATLKEKNVICQPILREARPGEEPAELQFHRWKDCRKPIKTPSRNQRAPHQPSLRPVALQEMIRELSSDQHGPANPGESWVKDEKKAMDEGGRWTFSLNAAGLTVQDVSTSQTDISSNDERTKVEEERRIGFRPELVLGYRGRHVDGTNTIKTEYETNRLGPNAKPNPLADSWTLRSEWDLFLFRDRNIVNLPLYLAGSLESQWRRPLQAVAIEDFDDPLTFPLKKRKELSFEVGQGVMNANKSKFFRFGFSVGRDFDRISEVLVQHPNPAIATIEGTPSKVGEAIRMMKACPPPDPDQPAPMTKPAELDCFSPGTPLAVQYTTENRLTLGFAFRGSYDVEFGLINGDKKLKFTTKLTDGNLFFTRQGDLPDQPRFRLQWANELSVPLWGNLSLVPGVEFFLFRNKGGVDPTDKTKEIPAKTFWSRKPYLRFDYKFDLKPAFMRFRDALRFRSG